MLGVGFLILAQVVMCRVHIDLKDLPEEMTTISDNYILSANLGVTTKMDTTTDSNDLQETKHSQFAHQKTHQKVHQEVQKDKRVFSKPVVPVRNTYFDHDKRLGPSFIDVPDEGNVTKITVQLGEDAYLNCRISLLQDKTVSWVRRRNKDEMPELLTVGAVTYSADDRISVGKRYPGNWRLLIKEVRADDEATYECQISTHPPRVTSIYLHVNTPQVWVVDEAGAPLQEKYYEAESTLALVCRARHVDTPAVLTWLHEGRALNADTTRGGINVKTEQVIGGADSLLRLARVNSSDAGNYTCAVKGAKSHTVAVHVLNEESLAELHAGATPLLSVLPITITTLFVPTVITDSLFQTLFTYIRLVFKVTIVIFQYFYLKFEHVSPQSFNVN